MSILTSARRHHLKSSVFGLPKERKYPMPDKSHAANAKARATQMVNKGKLSASSKKAIDAKANRILGKHTEGKTMKHSKEKKMHDGKHKMAAKHGHEKHMKHAAVHKEIAKHHAHIAKLHKKVK